MVNSLGSHSGVLREAKTVDEMEGSFFFFYNEKPYESAKTCQLNCTSSREDC